ncbi:conserved Plasmodium protein, unknown function [Plasmodium knowlesi strain H]|uniref:Uncharacterized protein n=3 Tax=Plasmodium knowlesi TaxID=5850 RepID=A0A5K1UZN3_PLAKH|nr:conserved Plasmodium protein, unknown function [Plasmodium knowlesi strain H]OTN67800.1 Uncharacterized protein PKNOH_S05373700 [Plasmodium knowlesi]CAA9990327.1 conserved Plasmodium protein, unknown function [Plasmodium knowlesi strain H]SBO19533.1 conserved Plasmodium protein, unknown function [Plasmodium knowlesi strain H]SBO22771.1 conserved Plasmodium protein, unknown function [Plasmodium knowlesi strain H]VVS79801.1 conserved Plasmodium protein, unknown function [Plasmodium knowlesi s|eukprot:XP_002260727.1 hypothetical protein, conserved in Plasmodium species [Plasmodium knowlesi strain H]
MKDIAFFFLPAGIGLSCLLLSGVALFQRIAISIQKRSINFQIYKYQVNVSVSSLISFYALLRLAFTILELKKHNDDKDGLDFSVHMPHVHKAYLKKMRLQRNFWILLLCSIAWVFYIRFTYLILYYREKVKKSDEEYEAIMVLKGTLNKCTNSVTQSDGRGLKYSETSQEEDLLSDSDITTDGNANTSEKSSVLEDGQRKNPGIRQRR